MQEYVWKIMHNPTGLFFSPSGYQQGKKSNLSENGKIYSKKPSFTYVKYAQDKDGNKLDVGDFSIRMYELVLASIAPTKNNVKKLCNILLKNEDVLWPSPVIPKPEFPHDLS